MNEFVKDDVETVIVEGITPSREGSVPLPIAEYLFGGTQRTYAIFDAAVLSEGTSLLREEEGYHGSLVEGAETTALEDVMPCLLELTPESRLVRTLFREVPGHPAALGRVHLWPSNPALFVRCNSDPQTLRKHLRRFLKPMDESGRRRFLRLWNPEIFFGYIQDIRFATPLLRLCHHAYGDPLTFIARKGASFAVSNPRRPPRPNDRPVLSRTDIEALTERFTREFNIRLVERVVARCEARGFRFGRDRIERIAEKVMAAMANHARDDVPTMSDHEKLTLVLLMMHDDATDIVISGPVMRNNLISWKCRVDIVAKSYLTGLRRLCGMEVA